MQSLHNALEDLATLRSENDRLKQYVRHKDDCGVIGGYGFCTCGLEKKDEPQGEVILPEWVTIDYINNLK